MPTIQCSSCGARYYSAATDQLLELVVALFGCEMCAERGPLVTLDSEVGYLAQAPEDQTERPMAPGPD